METRANHVAIGLFVVIVLTAALGSLWWLYKSSESGASETVRIIFPEPVTGLSTGGSVFFNGIRVGEISQLTFPETGGSTVIALARISPRAPVKTDTAAKLGFQGLTGIAYLSLTGGSPDAPSLFTSGEGDLPTLQAETSAFTDVLDSAQTVLGRIDTTLREVNTFLGDNRARLDEVVVNVNTLTGTLSAAAPQVSGLINDMSAAGREVAAAAPQITSVVERANALLNAVGPERVDTIVGNVEAFTGELPGIGQTAGTVVGRVDGLVAELDSAAGTVGEAVRAVATVAEAIDGDAVGAIVANVRDATGAIASRATALGATLDNAGTIASDIAGLTTTLSERQGTIGTAIDDAAAALGDVRLAARQAGPIADRIAQTVAAVEPERVGRIVGAAERVALDVSNQVPALTTFVTAATNAATNIAGVADTIASRNDLIGQSVSDAAALFDNLRTASTDVPDLVASVGARVGEAGDLIRAIDADAINRTVTGAATVADALAAEAPRVGPLVASVEGAARGVETIADGLATSIPTVQQTVDDAAASAAAVRTATERLPALAAPLEESVEGLSRALAAIDPEAVTDIVAGVRTVTDALSSRADTIATLADTAGAAADQINTVANIIAARTPQLGRIFDDVEATASGASAVTAGLRPAADDLATVIAAIDPEAVTALVTGASDFATGLAAQNAPIADLVAAARDAATGVETVTATLSEAAPQIRSAISRADATLGSAEAFAAELPGLLARVQPGVDNLGTVLASIDPAAVEALVGDASRFASGLAAQNQPIADLVASARDAATGVQTVTTTLSEAAPRIRSAIVRADATLGSAEAFAAELPGILASVRPGVDNLGTVLASIDPAAVEALVGDVSRFASGLAAQNQPIADLVAAARDAATGVETVATTLSEAAPQIRSAIARADATLGSAEAFAAELPGILASVRPGVDNLGTVLASIDPAAVEDLVGDASRFASGLAAQNQPIADLLSAARDAATGAQTVTATLAEAAPNLRSAITRADATLGSAEAFAAELPQILASVRPGLENAGTVLQSVDPQAVFRLVDDASSFVSGLAAQNEPIAALVTSAQTAAAGVATVTDTLSAAAPDIRSAITRANAALGDTETFAAALPGLVESVRPGVENAGAVLAAVDPEAVRGIARDVAGFAEVLGGQSEAVTATIDGARRTTTAAASLAETLSAREGEIGAIVTDAARAAQNVADAAGEVRGLTADAAPAVRQLAAAAAVVTPARVDDVLTQVQLITGGLAQQGATVEAIITDARATAEAARTIAGALAERTPQLTALVDDGAAALSSARAAAEPLPRLVAALEPGVRQAGDTLAALDPAALTAIQRDVADFAAAIAAQRDAIAPLVASAQATAQNAEAISAVLAESAPQIGAIVDVAGRGVVAATSLAEQLPGFGETLAPGLENASAVLQSIDAEAVNGLVRDVGAFAQTLSAESARLPEILADAQASAEGARTLLEGVAARTPAITATIDSAEAFAGRLPGLVDAIEPGVQNAGTVLAAIDPQAVAELVESARGFAGTLNDESETLRRLLARADRTAGAAETLATTLASRATDLDRAVVDAAGLLADARAFSGRLPGFGEALAPAIDRVAAVATAIDPAAVEQLVTDVTAFAGTLEGERARVAAILQEVDRMARGAGTLVEGVAARTETITGAIDAAGAFVDGLPAITDTLQPGIENLSTVLSAVDPAAVGAIVTDAQTFAATLGGQSETVRSLLTQADGIAARADRVVASIAERTPVLTEAIDAAGRAVGAADAFAQTLPTLANRLEPGIDNISTVLSSVDPQAVRRVVDNVETLSAALAAEAPRIGPIVQSVERASADAAAIATRVRGEMDVLSRGLLEAEAALVEARRFATGLPPLLERVEPGVDNLGAVLTAIDPAAITAIIDNVRGVSATLDGARDDIDTVLTTAGAAARNVEAVTAAISARVNQIDSAIAGASRFAQSLGEVAPDISGLVDTAGDALRGVRNTVSAVNTEAINRIIGNVETASAAIGTRATQIGTAIDDAVAAARGLADGLGTVGGEEGVIKDVLDQARRIGNNLEAASSRVGLLIDRAGNLLDGPAQSLVSNVSSAANDVGNVAAAFASRAESIAGGLSRFSQTGLDDLRSLLNQGRSTLAAIETAVSSFERNPSRVLFGGSDAPRYRPQRR